MTSKQLREFANTVHEGAPKSETALYKHILGALVTILEKLEGNSIHAN